VAIGLNDLKTKKANKPKLDLNLGPETPIEEKTETPIETRNSLKELSDQLKSDLEQFETKSYSPIDPIKGNAEAVGAMDMKRPWESFNIDEMTTHMRSQRAVKKAKIIVDRNNKLIEELRNRARLLEEDPESFFNQ
jgi:hypothetical protein